MVSRVILMDFDGVLMRHSGVLRSVQNRVVEYVRRNVGGGGGGGGGGNMTTEDARRLNRDLYGRYGHTHVGMKKLFVPHTRLNTFNDFVYDPGYLKEILEEYRGDAEVFAGMTQWNTWLDEQLLEGDVDKIAILTNSPGTWPKMWLEAAGMTERFQEILGSDHVLFEGREDSLLKPNLRLYERIEHYHGPTQMLYFVEDSPGNLEPLLHRPQWIPVLFDGEDVERM